MKPPPLTTLLSLASLLSPADSHGHGHAHAHNHKGHKPHTHGSRAIPSRGLDSGLNKPLLTGYSLTWHEEFTYAPNGATQPSTAKWVYETDSAYTYPGRPRDWGVNAELGVQSYSDDPAVIAITKAGTLRITPQKQRGQGRDGWVGARIETVRGDFMAERGGKVFVEARVRTCASSASSAPEEQGIASSFRLYALGDEFRAYEDAMCLNWPAASEWDIASVLHGQNAVHHALHCGSAPGGPCKEFEGLGGSARWSDCDWHYVGFEVDRTRLDGAGVEEWRENRLNWYVDGEKTFSVAGADVGDWGAWERVAHRGHFLVVDGAGEVEVEVDYVRVWNR
ncbi:uncharacterized protein DSM5745_10156 [Aspergillus mulundensis]|uniref:GH16 domain-containing protein n=1 Tax=Aspergillus mulundensis TaxID=1810919 RepID=A0A3D8QMM9_9EURO|nr:hypothetical protein DSM5745_10156 [Aspergillus mulundensis]RDW63045.1 hypothetical protein DSM5745_10156 [Aspergillus mulundensis]